MTEHDKTKRVGRKLLLGVVIAAMPLAGCEVYTQPSERSAYSAAMASRSVTDANAFLLRYPSSPLARQLLVSLPPETLKRLSRPAVTGLAPEVVRSLPANVAALLGLVATRPARTTDLPRASGYGG